MSAELGCPGAQWCQKNLGATNEHGRCQNPQSSASLRWVSVPSTSQGPDLCVSHTFSQPCAVCPTVDNGPNGPSPCVFSGTHGAPMNWVQVPESSPAAGLRTRGQVQWGHLHPTCHGQRAVTDQPQ